MTRVVEPEILDQLPSSDAAATRSRSDLARLNALMGHARWIRKHLALDVIRVIDLGAGDGTLLLKVVQSAHTVICKITLVDQQRIVNETTLAAFRDLGIQPTVVIANVCDWLAQQSNSNNTAIVANLFLHHFNPSALQHLLDLASKACDVFIACEPRRGVWPRAAASLVGLMGCNHVTRHDAVVSVRAGFRDCELTALWPDRARWQIEERAAGLFSHLFVARRG